MELNKEELVELLKKLSAEGSIMATWEGITVGIQDISITPDGVIILDVNEF